MEVNNRFDLLASLSVNDESIESSTNDIHLPEQKQDIEQPIKNFWEIPEYVDKPIPCLSPLVPKEETPKSVAKVNVSGQKKKVKPIIDNSKPEEETPPIVIVHTEPTISSYYPPQPYKFKPAAASKINLI
jgi:hypothetical protein